MDDTAYYIVSFVAIVLLVVIQKYSYYIDIWFSGNSNNKWKGKPWPLIAGVVVGLLIYVFGITNPEGLEWNLSRLSWQEYSLILICFFTLLGIAIESIKHFKGIRALLRLLIWTILTMVYVVAGVYTGLLLSIAIAVFIVIYFLFFWKKRLKIS